MKLYPHQHVNRGHLKKIAGGFIWMIISWNCSQIQSFRVRQRCYACNTRARHNFISSNYMNFKTKFWTKVISVYQNFYPEWMDSNFSLMARPYRIDRHEHKTVWRTSCQIFSSTASQKNISISIIESSEVNAL